MDDTAYNALVSTAFKRLLKGIDTTDPDLVEADSTGDMIVVTSAKSGEKVVINTQRAVWQIWVAGKSTGVHFNHAADGRWLDDKGKGLELFSWVSDCIDAATGQRIAF